MPVFIRVAGKKVGGFRVTSYLYILDIHRMEGHQAEVVHDLTQCRTQAMEPLLQGAANGYGRVRRWSILVVIILFFSVPSTGGQCTASAGVWDLAVHIATKKQYKGKERKDSSHAQGLRPRFCQLYRCIKSKSDKSSDKRTVIKVPSSYTR